MSASESNAPQTEQPASESEEYEVDYILKTRMHSRKRFFLVRWKGFGPEADSWEPIDMLTVGAKETVDEYMAKLDAEKKSQAKKRSKPTIKIENDSDEIPSSSPSRNASSSGDEFDPKRSTSRRSGAAARRGRKSAKTTPSAPPSKVTQRVTRTTRRQSTETTSNPTRRSSNRTSVTAWFMESSDSDEHRVGSRSNTPSRQIQQARDNRSSMNVSAISTTAPSDDIPGPSGSSLLGSLKMSIRRTDASVATPTLNPTPIAQSSRGLTAVFDARRSNLESPNANKSSNRGKKDKKNKKYRKNRIQLEFVGCYRPAEDRPLSFVTRQIYPEVTHNNTRIYTLEESIELDSQSLAQYLASYISFSSTGTPIVRPPLRSPSSSYDSY